VILLTAHSAGDAVAITGIPAEIIAHRPGQSKPLEVYVTNPFKLRDFPAPPTAQDAPSPPAESLRKSLRIILVNRPVITVIAASSLRFFGGYAHHESTTRTLIITLSPHVGVQVSLIMSSALHEGSVLL
jgi:hypothetical protein